jgi:uncharacterized protein (DUF4415 family)
LKPRPEKPPHVSRESWDSVDVPVMADGDLARAKPFKEVFPNAFESWRRGPGRPKLEAPKVHVGFRLAPEVVEGIKATGRGYNSRVEQVLREALAQGRLRSSEAGPNEHVGDAVHRRDAERGRRAKPHQR